MIVKAHNPSRKTQKRKAEDNNAQGSSSHCSGVTAFAAPESSQTSAPQTPAKTRAPRGLHTSSALPEGGDSSIVYPNALEAYRKIRNSQQQQTAAAPSPFASRGGAPSTTMATVLPSVSSASKTRWQEHQKRLRQVNAMMNSGGIRKQKSSATTSTPSWRKNVLGRIVGAMRTNALSDPDASSASFQDPDVIGEFDRDVSEAMVTIGGRFVGLDPQELMHSQGLRKLVARNIRWFQNTPDWLKLVGLVVAKRLNSAVRSTSIMQNNQDNAVYQHQRIEGLDDLPVTLPPCSPPPMMHSAMDEDGGEVAPPLSALPLCEDEQKNNEEDISIPTPPPPPTKKAAKSKRTSNNKAAQESNPSSSVPNPSASASEDIPDSSFF